MLRPLLCGRGTIDNELAAVISSIATACKQASGRPVDQHLVVTVAADERQFRRTCWIVFSFSGSSSPAHAEEPSLFSLHATCLAVAVL